MLGRVMGSAPKRYVQGIDCGWCQTGEEGLRGRSESVSSGEEELAGV